MLAPIISWWMMERAQGVTSESLLASYRRGRHMETCRYMYLVNDEDGKDHCRCKHKLGICSARSQLSIAMISQTQYFCHLGACSKVGSASVRADALRPSPPIAYHKRNPIVAARCPRPLYRPTCTAREAPPPRILCIAASYFVCICSIGSSASFSTGSHSIGLAECFAVAKVG